MTAFKSQLGQDKWIVELFKGKRNGYFIDIGAWDGEDISNTYYLEKELGWTGVCVEPQHDAFINLQNVRTCSSENIVFAEKTGMVFFKNAGTGSGIVSGLGPDVNEIPAITITELLTRYKSPAIIDYLSLDTEGNELEIMRTFPFDRFHFRALTVEHNSYMGSKHVKRRGEMHQLLEINGYKFVKQQDCDDFYTE